MTPRQAHDPARQRRWLIGTLVSVGLTLALIAGGPWVYARYLKPEAPEPLGLGVEAEAEALSVGPEVLDEIDGTWHVGGGSEAGYRLGEVLSGQQVTVVGRTSEVSGSIVVEDATVTAADIRVDVAAIRTDESARDAFFRRALDTSAHPEASFVLGEPVDVGGLVGSAEPVAVDALGTLTVNGVSRPASATFQVQVTSDAEVEVVGHVPVVLGDYGLAAPDLGFVTVEPEGTIEVLLALTR